MKKNLIYICTSILPLALIVINIILFFIVGSSLSFISYMPFYPVSILNMTLHIPDINYLALGGTTFVIFVIAIVSLIKKNYIFALINVCSSIFLFSYTMWFIDLIQMSSFLK